MLNAMANTFMCTVFCAVKDKASVVSKAKVGEVQKIDKTFYLVSFKDQLEVGREPLRPAEQGDRSYLGLPVDG
jgi:hypothetical protein